MVRRAGILTSCAGGCAGIDGAERGQTSVTAWPRDRVGEGFSRADDAGGELVVELDSLALVLENVGRDEAEEAVQAVGKVDGAGAAGVRAVRRAGVFKGGEEG